MREGRRRSQFEAREVEEDVDEPRPKLMIPLNMLKIPVAEYQIPNRSASVSLRKNTRRKRNGQNAMETKRTEEEKVCEGEQLTLLFPIPH